MGIFQKLRGSSTESRLLTELTEIAGKSHGLVERLRKHAAMCAYPNLRHGVETIAEREAAHLKALDAILSDHNLWSRFPEPSPHDGANNWERLSLDLAVLAELATTLQRIATQWQPIDSALSDKLDAIAAEDAELESELRKLALKCDPQALD